MTANALAHWVIRIGVIWVLISFSLAALYVAVREIGFRVFKDRQ